MNLPLIPVFGMVLLFAFLHLLSHFHAVIQDFPRIVHLAYQIMFTTIPLVASTLISVYLCEEVASFELSTVFVVVYAFYSYWLCRPRTIYLPDTTKVAARIGTNAYFVERTVLPHHIYKAIYALPVVFSLIIHLSLYHSTLGISRAAASSLLQAGLFPTMLMLMIYKRHFPEEFKFDRVILAAGIGYILAIVDHPVFDDLRQFSGFPKALATHILTAFALFLMLSVFFVRKLKTFQSDESFSSDAHSRYYSLLRVGSAMSNAITMGLLCLLINMPASVLPFCLFGSVALSELFFHPHKPISKFALAFFSSASMLLVIPEFFKGTIYYIGFNWAWHVDFTMRQFCNVIILLMIFYVLVPVILDHPTATSNVLPIDTHRSKTRAVVTWNHESLVFFSFIFILLSLLIAALELMVLEQVYIYLPSC